jgi:hypothetical protein
MSTSLCLGITNHCQIVTSSPPSAASQLLSTATDQKAAAFLQNAAAAAAGKTWADKKAATCVEQSEELSNLTTNSTAEKTMERKLQEEYDECEMEIRELKATASTLLKAKNDILKQIQTIERSLSESRLKISKLRFRRATDAVLRDSLIDLKAADLESLPSIPPWISIHLVVELDSWFNTSTHLNIEYPFGEPTPSREIVVNWRRISANDETVEIVSAPRYRSIPIQLFLYGDSLLTKSCVLRPLDEALRLIKAQDKPIQFALWLMYQFAAGPLKRYLQLHGLVLRTGSGRDDDGNDLG